MTDDERELLLFEEQYPRDDRQKEAAIRGRFAMSWVRYQQRLLQLVARGDVLAAFPVVVHQVHRATDHAVAARAAKRF